MYHLDRGIDHNLQPVAFSNIYQNKKNPEWMHVEPYTVN